MRATSRIRFVLRMLKLERPALFVRGDSFRSRAISLANGTGLARVDELLHGLPRIWVPSRQIIIDERLQELVNMTLPGVMGGGMSIVSYLSIAAGMANRLVVLPGLVRMRDCKQLLGSTTCPAQAQATPTMHQVQIHCLIVSDHFSTNVIYSARLAIIQLQLPKRYI